MIDEIIKKVQADGAEYLGMFKGAKIHSVFYNELRNMGLPLFIIEKDGEFRTSLGYDETFEIFDYFKVGDED